MSCALLSGRYFGARMIGATTANFIRMAKVLDRNTRMDEANHFIADWHDESHYNHYVNVSHLSLSWLTQSSADPLGD